MQKKLFYIVTTQISQENPLARWWESPMKTRENNKIFESFEEGMFYMRNKIKELALNGEVFPLEGNRYKPIDEFDDPELDELNDIIVNYISNPSYDLSDFEEYYITDEGERHYAFVANKDIVLVDYDNTRLSFNIHNVKDLNDTYFLEYECYDNNGRSTAKVSFKLANTIEKQSDGFDKSIKRLENGRKIITFGSYKQTAKGDDKTPIEWQVLGVKYGRATLVANKCLDVLAFDENGRNEWGKNTLSQWLETEFKNAAFSKEEQKRLYKGFPIKILPKRGVETFFQKGKDRLCEYTDYVKEKYGDVIGDKLDTPFISWWTDTRTEKENVFRVGSDGEIDEMQPCCFAGVRPVIFLKID